VRAFLKRIYIYCQITLQRWRLLGSLRKAQTRLQSFDRPHRLHLGCGQVRLVNWINIDADESLETTDIVWNLTCGIPVSDSSCALIYCEHFLEHLTVEQGLVFLRECYRALQPGGVLRVAMPSLDVLIEKSYLGNWREQNWLDWKEFHFVQTRAEMLNISFRWWGHQWLYDREELHRRLGEAGFVTIRDSEWGQSNVKGMEHLETRQDSRLICEAQK